MKLPLVIITLLASCQLSYSQTVQDLFLKTNYPIVWLGIDFTHVKFVGDFTQLSILGEKSMNDMKAYFPQWNRLVVTEPDKYNVGEMLRKDNLRYDIEMVSALNSECRVSDMEAFNNPNYQIQDILQFVDAYEIESQVGIGVLFIAESLNKVNEESYFHFVAINMKTKQILLHERIRGEPSGIGLRNYWAGSIYNVMKTVKGKYYKTWKKQYL